MSYQILLGIVIGLIIVGIFVKLMQYIKTKDAKKKDEIIKELLVQSLTEALKVISVKNEEELKKYCVEILKRRLEEQGITDVTEDEIKQLVETIVKLVNQ